MTSVFSIWKCEYIARTVYNFGVNFFWLFFKFLNNLIRMKFSTLFSPKIMFILRANQNARVIMKVYYAHCDWLNARTRRHIGYVRSFYNW